MRYLIAAGALIALAIPPSALAGPADSYGDQCTRMYLKDDYVYCVTPKGRVFYYNEDNKSTTGLAGILGKDYNYATLDAYIIRRFEKINNGNKLIEYRCHSDGRGNCNGASKKYVHNYLGPL
jgi:hypothetical protein